MASRKQVAQGTEVEEDAVASPAFTSASAPVRKLCTDPEALRLAGFLVERVRMFKLPNNQIVLIQAPDGTVTIESIA